MEEGIVVPQIDTNSSNKTNAQAPAVAAITGDNATDLANIAREMGLDQNAVNSVTGQPQAQPVAVTPPVPARPQAAPQSAQTPVEVPPKFQNVDGTVNEEKLEKSTKSLEERVAYFKSLEREHSQKQNKAQNPPPAPVYQQPPAPQTGIQLTEFERQAAIDILNDAKALEIQMTDQQAILQARADIRMADAKYSAEKSGTDEIRRELAENRMTAELQTLLDADESLATPETANRVIEIKQERGFKTYREAYIHHLGEVAIAQRTGQVQTPIPKGQTPKAPPTAVGPVQRVQPTVNLDNPKALSNEQLEAQIRQMYPTFRGDRR